MSITLHKGDCLVEMGKVAAGSVESVVTDPPYNVVNRESGGLRLLDKDVADSSPIDIPRLAAEFVRVCFGSIYVWCGTEQISAWRAAFVALGLSTRHGVWVKSNPSPMNGEKMWLSGIESCVFARKPKATFNRFCASPVWRGSTARVKGFPCPKPVWLMEELVRASTTPGATVLDPFMGSGTTGVACVNTRRKFIGIEQNDEYFEVARRRIAEAQESLYRRSA